MKSGYVVSPPLKSPTPPRPYSRVNTLREIKDITECLSRNHSYTEKLRDDHQLNLKQEKELKKENRRVKRELKAQELAEIAEEVRTYIYVVSVFERWLPSLLLNVYTCY